MKPAWLNQRDFFIEVTRCEYEYTPTWRGGCFYRAVKTLAIILFQYDQNVMFSPPSRW
jgi:hypothetical protein